MILTSIGVFVCIIGRVWNLRTVWKINFWNLGASWKNNNPSGFAIGAVGIRGRRGVVRHLLNEAGFSEPHDAVCIA